MKRFFRSLRDGLLVVLFFTSLVFIVFLLREGETEHISGLARVVDGDSIEIHDKSIRLAGIDAPEIRQKCKKDDEDFRCGLTAKDHLKGLIRNGNVDCRIFGNDFYDRILAACFVGETEINKKMVLDGWAVDYGGYASAEKQASTAKRGIWASKFDVPEDYRRQKGASNENSISHRVAYAKLNAIRIGAELARKFGLHKD